MLYLRSRPLIHQGAKFAVVGLAGVVIVIAGADVLHYTVGLGKYASVTIATVAGMIPNFAANRHWTFQHREQHVTWRETVLFFALNCAGMLFQYVCIGITQAVPGMSGRFWYTTANLLGLGLGAAFRFWSYRRWVWHAPPVRALPGRPEACKSSIRSRPARRPARTRGEPSQADQKKASVGRVLHLHPACAVSTSRPAHSGTVRLAPTRTDKVPNTRRALSRAKSLSAAGHGGAE